MPRQEWQCWWGQQRNRSAEGESATPTVGGKPQWGKGEGLRRQLPHPDVFITPNGISQVEVAVEGARQCHLPGWLVW